MSKIVKVDCASRFQELREALKIVMREKREGDYQIGALLHEIWSKGLHKQAFPTWTAFVEKETDLTERHATLYVRLIGAGFTRLDFKRVGMSKLTRRIRIARGVCTTPVVVQPGPTMTLVGEVAEAIMRLAKSMGCSPQKYVELMVHASARRAGKRDA